MNFRRYALQAALQASVVPASVIPARRAKGSIRYGLGALAGLVLLLAGVSPAAAASFSLSPASGSPAVGDTFSVAVQLDTGGADIVGADALIEYDPTALSLGDAFPGAPGTQIQPGSLMPNDVFNSVDTSTGSVSFSQVEAVGGSTFSGSGTFATLDFTALRSGTTRVAFDFTPGDTTDSNIASPEATDLLSEVTDGTYTVASDGGAAPIPEPTGAAAFALGLALALPALKRRRSG